MAFPSASDAPTTSPSPGNTSSVHVESPRPIPENRYVLSHPRLHLPACATRAPLPARACDSLIVHNALHTLTHAPAHTEAPWRYMAAGCHTLDVVEGKRCLVAIATSALL